MINVLHVISALSRGGPGNALMDTRRRHQPGREPLLVSLGPTEPADGRTCARRRLRVIRAPDPCSLMR